MITAYTKCQVFNASIEVAKAANYPKIRIFMAALKKSPVPVDELLGISKIWSIASPGIARPQLYDTMYAYYDLCMPSHVQQVFHPFLLSVGSMDVTSLTI